MNWGVPIGILIAHACELVVLDDCLHYVQLSLDANSVFLILEFALVKEVNIFLATSNVKEVKVLVKLGSIFQEVL